MKGFPIHQTRHLHLSATYNQWWFGFSTHVWGWLTIPYHISYSICVTFSFRSWYYSYYSLYYVAWPCVRRLTRMTQEESIFVVRGRDKIGIREPADIRVSSECHTEKSVSDTEQWCVFKNHCNDHCESEDGREIWRCLIFNVSYRERMIISRYCALLAGI